MASTPYVTTYSSDIALLGSRSRRLWSTAGVALLMAAPFVLSGVSLHIAARLFIVTIGAIALNMLMGVAGILSLGAAAFLAIGAFVGATLALDLNLPFVAVLIGAGLGAALVGVLVALFTARLRGLYIIMATFALHFVTIFVASQYQVARVGTEGFFLPRVAFGPWTSRSPEFWYYVTLIVAGLSLIAAANIMRSGVGRSWIALRDRDLVAEALGVNLFRTKIVAFAGSSFLFGIAGALNAYFVGHTGAEAYSLALAIQYIAIIIIGGMGLLLGSVIGAAFFVLLPYLVRWVVRGGLGVSFESALGDQLFEVQAALYGVAIVVFMLIEPGGIAALWYRRVKRYFVVWPFQRRWELDGQ